MTTTFRNPTVFSSLLRVLSSGGMYCLRRGVLSTLVIAALCCPLSAHADAAPDFFYAGGKKHFLVTSTRWAVVELQRGVAGETVAAQAKNIVGVDTTQQAVLYGRQRLVVLPLAASTERAAQQAESKLSKLPGVQRRLRAFRDGKAPIIETDEILIQFKPSVTPAQIKLLLAPYGATVVEPLGKYAPNGFVVRVPDTSQHSSLSVANALYEKPQVIFSHPNFIWPLETRFQPNDILFGQQWNLFNVAQGGGAVGADIKAPQAWDITRGSPGITIAVIDDGIDTTHEEFQGRLVPGYDFVDNDADPQPGSGDSHGTACAGLAAGAGGNRVGISGVAPRCKLMPIRLIHGGVSIRDQADAFRFAVDGGADVISNSWGPQDGLNVEQPLPDAVRGAINYAVTSGRGGKGCVVLFAAGNGNESADLDGYSSNPQVMSIAAADNFDKRPWYSDFGSSVDFCAPSNGGTLGITTTDRSGTSGFSSTGYFNDFNGTSAACPQMAGVAALMLAVDPNQTYLQVRTRLRNTADKIDPTGSGRDGDGNVFSYAYDSNGHSKAYGYGRVNARRALQSVLAVHLVAPASGSTIGGSFVVSATTSKSQPLVQRVEFARRPAVVGFSRTPNRIVPNDSTINDSQTLSAPGTVGEATLSLNIEHDFIGDLAVKLFAPDGSFIWLHKDDGIADVGRPGALIYTDRVLWGLTGKPIAGTWRLQVSDTFPTEAGRLISWSLRLWQPWTTIARDGNGPALSGPNSGRWTSVWDTSSTPSGLYEVRARAVTANAAVQDVHTNVRVSNPTSAPSSVTVAAAAIPEGRSTPSGAALLARR